MQTKYVLHIDDADFQLSDEDLKNWAEIRCSYSRQDLGGVTRSFTSKFEFAGRAYELLLAVYLREGFAARAVIDVLTLTETWEYETRFSCPLDFSTIEWTDTVLSINAVDSSLAAKLKAAKSTKYELVIGTDIIPDRQLYFDRIPMTETATYEITGGESYDDCADLMVTLGRDELPYVGNVGSDISIGLAVEWNDDQTGDPDSFLFRALGDLVVELDYLLSWRRDDGGVGTNIGIGVRREGRECPEAVKALASNHGDREGFMGLPGNGGFKFVGSYSSAEALKEAHPSPVYMQWALVDEEVWAVWHINTTDEWHATGQTREEYFTYESTGKKRLTLIQGDEVYIYSKFPGPLQQQEAVFRIVRSRFAFSWRTEGKPVFIDVFHPATVLAALMSKISDDTRTTVEIDDADPRLSGTYVMAAESARGITGAKLYTSFSDFSGWMESVFGYVHKIEGNKLGFLHRSTVFNHSARTFTIANVRNTQYKVAASRIYSTVTAGYDKKDYDSINGRDEFNFSNTYTTGCTVTDNKLTLTSKYRADSYGIEFAVQKRGADTTDSDSDQSVFFALCTEDGERLVPDRSLPLEGTLSEKVFNSAFSPMACVMANAGLVGMQSRKLTLAFASSTGNSSVVADSVPMSSDLVLGTPLGTCGILEAETDELGIEGHEGDIINVSSSGLTYRCYLESVDISYSREETAKYKLIVKEVVS